MKEVKIKRTNNARYFRASIDDVRLQFDTSGNASRNLKAGTHRLTWSVLGNPGNKYTIEITSPSYVICKGSGTLDSEGIDFGRCQFVIQ